ncbi:hypothetical protein [Roseateles sp. LYH14W]|uniref:EF-hand domain-containing protein n=1 Tax=Pelomonas parva TaxID=3299032 RepID=A0ABW7F5G3_9BURK
MITAVNAQVPAAAGSGSAPPRQAERADAEQAAKAQDGGGNQQSAVVRISAQGARPAGGQPPAGAGAKAAGATSSSAETYEPADANEDGKVSVQEQQAYDARLAAEKAANSGRTAQADAAVKAYEAVEQLGQDSGTAA